MKNSDPHSEFNFDTKILRYLIGIMDEKSLSKAAEKFYISQPALSRYLKNVEEKLGVPLFIHNRNRLEPTNAGKIFINGARSMVHIEETALKELRISHKREQRLEVWTEELFLPILDSAVCPAFRQEFPDISLQITTSTDAKIRSSLTDGTADFGLFLGDEIESPFFTCVRLFDSQLVFCTPQEEGAQDRQSYTGALAGLHPDSEFLLSPRNSYLRRVQEQILEEQGITPRIGGELSLAFLKELLRSGYGNTILPELLVNDCIPQERMFPFSPPRICCGLLGQYQGRAASEAAECFCHLAIYFITDPASFH